VSNTRRQIFLGGTCGTSTWRQKIAIPVLEAAGVTYYNPQLGIGEWTPACEAAEMVAKERADVLLFVISAETRGVASIGEAAYLLGCRRPLALMVADIGESDCIDGRLLTVEERNDLNRGRIFVRSMAHEIGVPVFSSVQAAVEHAIQLVREVAISMCCNRLQAILADVRCGPIEFLTEEIPGGFLIWIRCEEEDIGSGVRKTYHGRKWHVARDADESDVVRTAFKAVATWQEHEARDRFEYRGVPIFGAHAEVGDLVRVLKKDTEYGS